MTHHTETALPYTTITQLREMPTEKIREIQLEVNSLLDTPTPPVYSEEFKRLLGKCAKVLSERHKDPQLQLWEAL